MRYLKFKNKNKQKNTHTHTHSKCRSKGPHLNFAMAGTRQVVKRATCREVVTSHCGDVEVCISPFYIHMTSTFVIRLRGYTTFFMLNSTIVGILTFISRINTPFQCINTFAAKHLKKPIPQCQACFKDT